MVRLYAAPDPVCGKCAALSKYGGMDVSAEDVFRMSVDGECCVVPRFREDQTLLDVVWIHMYSARSSTGASVAMEDLHLGNTTRAEVGELVNPATSLRAEYRETWRVQVLCPAHAPYRAQELECASTTLRREYQTTVYTCLCYGPAEKGVRLSVAPELLRMHFPINTGGGAVIQYVTGTHDSFTDTPTRYGAVVTCTSAQHRFMAEVMAVGGEPQAFPLTHPDQLHVTGETVSLRFPPPHARWDPKLGSFLRPNWIQWNNPPSVLVGNTMDGEDVRIENGVITGIRSPQNLSVGQVGVGSWRVCYYNG